MAKDGYSLIEEPWICLLSGDGKVTKEGLRNVFLRTREYLDLSGDIRLQDMAVLRLLIAISVTLLYRYDENGVINEVKDSKQALKRFKTVWNAGGYNEFAVCDYFYKWGDRFFLFDEDHPFFQITLDGMEWMDDKEAYNGKKPKYKNGVYMNWMPIASMNGRIQRTNNKPDAPYKDLSGDAENGVDFAEAARWLIFYNAYADCTVGKRQHYKTEKGKEESANAEMTLPSRGSLITPVGSNLFETLMLNSVLFDIERNALYSSVCPVWEEKSAEEPIVSDRPVPDDLPRMYTQQARRIYLVREKDRVVGGYVSAGEGYLKSQMWKEPAFMMRQVKDKDSKELVFSPMQCSSGVDIWREIDHIAGDHGAAVTRWVKRLQQEEDFLSEDSNIPFRVTGISYGSMNCGIQSMTEDSILLDRHFLKDTEELEYAADEINVIDGIADAIRIFGNNCGRCMNLSNRDTRIGKLLSSQYYSFIGIEFRKFLAGQSEVGMLREKEFVIAKKMVKQCIAENFKALIRGKTGDNGMFLGKAEALFYNSLSKLERR